MKLTTRGFTQNVIPNSFRDLHLVKTQGFTLIELLVVVLIIGILAAVAVPQYQKAVAKTRGVQVITFLNTYTKAVDVWNLEHDCVAEVAREDAYERQESFLSELNMDVTTMFKKIQETNPPDLGSWFDCLAVSYYGDEFGFVYKKGKGHSAAEDAQSSWALTNCDGYTNFGGAVCKYLTQHLPIVSN